MRLLRSDGCIMPGKTYTIKSGEREFSIATRLDDNWDPDDFKNLNHFKFASDFEIKTLNNRHTTYGLGVPLIAVRTASDSEDVMEKYYPDILSFACTALLQCEPTGNVLPDGQPETKCELVVYNPLTQSH